MTILSQKGEKLTIHQFLSKSLELFPDSRKIPDTSRFSLASTDNWPSHTVTAALPIPSAHSHGMLYYEDVKIFPGHKAHSVALISISLALRKTPV